MREAAFVRKNKKSWIQFEQEINSSHFSSTERMVDLYAKILDDLSYAKTYYNRGKTPIYLNQLAIKAHLLIYKKKKLSENSFTSFWKFEIPLLIVKYKKEFLFTFIYFLACVTIGLFSVNKDFNFLRTILGDSYVEITISNIKSGNPAGIYNNDSPFFGFMMIVTNNIRVGLICFFSGLLSPVVPLFLLFYNGIMLGAFTGFFNHYDAGLEANSIIWIHGTIEIFVCIVSGATGIILGNSLLFPRTYTRLQSVRRGIKEGGKICLSTIPFFVCAAFLESYISRYSKMPLYISLLIISISAFIIIGYYIIYPFFLNKKINSDYKHNS